MSEVVDSSNLAMLKQELLSRFNCQKSGNCCRREGYVYVTPVEMKSMADFLDVSLAQFQRDYVIREDGWSLIASPTHRVGCFVNSENGCSIYPVRPKACKTYPHWESLWQTKESVLAELSMCPGLKKAYDAFSQSLESAGLDNCL